MKLFFFSEIQQKKEIISSDTDILTEDDDDAAKYERILKAGHKKQKEQSVSKPTFKNILLSFATVKRMPHTSDVLKFWKDDENFRELRPVAQVILGVPVTQVTVEQLFSQLKFIDSDLRPLKSSNTNNILVVRCNFNLLDDFIENY